MKFIILALTFFINAADTAPTAIDAMVIDVRTAEEFSGGHAKAAMNIDFKQKDFEKNISKLDKNKKYYVYCQAGGRSAKAVQKMKELGFKKVEDIQSVDKAKEKFGTEGQ
ncbi:MAG: rhodanese-like domain-containing protein [Bdellovibrionaceae bacterium]|nr:rhodanese-like domain-containing protein [Pseudobdellovibrionaceae bacterium]